MTPENNQEKYQQETARAIASLESRASSSLKKMGRPSEYSDETADKICALIAGGLSLNKISQMEGMPSIHTIYGWMRVNTNFLQRYSQARLDQADTLADEIMSISDDTEHATDPVQVAAARLRVEARRWIAARLKPSKWGDKASVEVSGPDGSPLPVVSVQFVQPGQKLVEGEVIEGK